MSAEACFRVLGPLDVGVGESAIEIPSGRLRTVLAVLLAKANREAGILEIAEKVWDDGDLPVDARSTVQKYILRLRRMLSETGAVITTSPNGYQLNLRSEQLDLNQFRELVHVGRKTCANGDLRVASRNLSDALALWRDVPPFTNITSARFHEVETPVLIEEYLQALELRIDIDLRLGRHNEVISQLLKLVNDHPFRERFWVQRMQALHGAGRRSEALDAYRQVAKLLSDDLGVTPGSELQEIHQTVLRGEPPDATSREEHGARQIAHEFPMVVAGIAGRTNAIDLITNEMISEHGQRVVIVTGRPGSGKTATAVHAARRLSEAFPDGQLFVDLRGHTGEPPAVEQSVARLLRALDVSAADMPDRCDDAMALFRTITARRHLLVVLDDAISSEHVTALLPGGVNCGVIVTSRCELTGLLTDPGGRQVVLEELTIADALSVLSGLIGDDRVRAELSASTELCEACDRLPLALRGAGAYLATRPYMSVANFVRDLRTDDGLSVLQLNGPNGRTVADAIRASYDKLSSTQRRLLSRIAMTTSGLFSARDMLTNAVSVAPAITGVEELAGRNLLDRRPGGKYELDPLTRQFVMRSTLAQSWAS